MTATEALQSASQHLAADPHLADNARRDAELLLLHTLDISKAALLANPARELTSEQQTRYQAAITRRLRHEPIQCNGAEQVLRLAIPFGGLSLEIACGAPILLDANCSLRGLQWIVDAGRSAVRGPGREHDRANHRQQDNCAVTPSHTSSRLLCRRCAETQSAARHRH